LGRGASLIGVLVPFMLSAYAVFSISMVVNQLSEALAASRPLVLWAIPIDFIGGAVGGLLIGHLADRAGRRKALYLAGLTFSLAVLLASSIRELWQLYLAWFFVGFGVNAQNGVSYSVIVELLRGSRGLVGGLMQGLYFIGFFLDAVTYYVVPSWRTFFLVVGLVSLLLTLSLTHLVIETYPARAQGLGLRYFDLRLAVVTAGLSAIVVGAFMFSVPLLSLVPSFIASMDLSEGWLTFLSMLGFLGFLVAGWLSDLGGRLRTAVALSGLGLLSSLALALTQGGYAGLTALSLMFFSSGYFSFTGVWASETYPAEFRATGTNLVFLVGRIVGGFSTIIAAYLYPSSLRVGTALTCIIANSLALAGGALYVVGLRVRSSRGS